MRIDAQRTAQILAESTQAPQAVKQSIQIATLKKALDNQKQEATELLKQLEPKGRVIDILV